MVPFILLALFVLALAWDLIRTRTPHESYPPYLEYVRKGEYHLFEPLPSGWLTSPDVFAAYHSHYKAWVLITMFVIMGWLWLIFNVPELFGFGVAYLLMYIIAVMLAMADLSRPIETWWVAVPRPVGVWGPAVDLLLGAAAGIFFLAIATSIGVAWAFPPVVTGLARVLLIGVMVPITEEYLINKGTSTGIELLGVIPGIAINSIAFWMIMHYAIYGLTGPTAIFLLLFGIFRGLTILFTKSYVPSIIAHCFVNIGAVLV